MYTKATLFLQIDGREYKNKNKKLTTDGIVK